MSPTRTHTDGIRTELIAILSQLKGRDVGPELVDHDDFVQALNLDSLDAVELTVRLSGDFGVEFGAEPEDLDALESLRTLVDLVARRAVR